MKLLVIIINDRSKLTPVLDEFYELGIKGATVVDSHGMGHLIADHISLFSRFAEIGDPTKDINYTIFSVIKDEELIDKAIHAVEKVVGDLNQADTGFTFVVPVDYLKGLPHDTDN